MSSGMTTHNALQNPAVLRTPLRVRALDLQGPAGRLEALLNEGVGHAPCAALICHPHPLGGGTMHNKVVYHAMKAINDPLWGLGWPVLRFNFRGVDLSQGEHDGQAEADDVLAALNWLENEFKLPIAAVGFSFGAAMTLSACCRPDAAPSRGRQYVRALASIGLPTHAEGRDYSYPYLDTCPLPKFFLSGDRDPFAPADQLANVVASAAEPKRLQLLAGADHFFTGQMESMQSALSNWLKEQLQ
jgi:hypothetical protein